MAYVAIIADDLTGANATGSLLARDGFRVGSCLSLAQWDEKAFADFDVVALNAASRLIPEHEARSRMAKGMELVLPLSPKVVSKRIDSTLRGNLGGEIEAALASMDAYFGKEALAVVVPAFPASGRVVVGGMMLVNGVPLENTSIAKDPVTPIVTSVVMPIIARQTALPGGSIMLDTVLGGPYAVHKRIMELQASGCRMVVIDAATDDEIRTVAEALKGLDFPILAVDPGPFTAALAQVLAGKPPRIVEDRALAVVGSVTELTRRQLETLQLERPCFFARAECRLLIDPQTREAETRRVVELASSAPDDARIIGICTAQTEEHVQCLSEIGCKYGLAQHEASDALSDALAEIAARLLKKPELRIGGLYTSGGEVTVTVTSKLKAGGVFVRDEVMALVMYGHLIGGEFPDLPIVTKGGFVGDARGLVVCMDYLLAKISTKTRLK